MVVPNFMDGTEVISSYSDSEAVEDGMLFDLIGYHSAWKDGPFSYVTRALMLQEKYLVDDKVNKAALCDLLHQCALIMQKEVLLAKKADYFYSGEIEFPSGKRGKVFMAQNESGKFTIMLPEDY